jgi:Fe-S-cluster-containing dehydrogenase component/formate-dependent nitrite reductase membrane component NrfD
MDESIPSAALGAQRVDVTWIKVLDQTRCIGCHACTVACKSENEVPLSVTRTYVKSVEVGVFPQVRRSFQVTRCNQCEDAPCVSACPTSAMFKRADGIVDFDKRICIGCKACIAACPYDAIFINPDDHSAEKCNFCAHRVDAGLEPACVVVCPTQAILIGNLHDPQSKAAQIVNRQPVEVRRPEKETRPKVFYRGAHQATLDPLAARRPEGGLFMWSEQPAGAQEVTSGHPRRPNTSAEALLSYDVAHRAPWDWRVSLYTWTKGVAAGTFLTAVILALTGRLAFASPVYRLAVPVLSGGFLALTGLILIGDLEHPLRFLYIFTRPQWRSWLVRGALLITLYGLALGAQFLLGLAGLQVAWLAVPGVPLAILAAVYTAYLFAQAKARDLWQSPLLPPHMAVQALLAGSAALVPVLILLAPAALPADLWLVSGAALAHLLLVAGELTLTHPTAHAHLAVWEMTRGRYATWFWIGNLAVLLAIAAPTLWPLALAGLIGLLLHEHAYVQAGQAVPLA